jgi:hypothetical protein
VKNKPRTYTLIESKSVFQISLLVIGLTIIGVFFWGLGNHHTFFENSIISTTILSIVFFFFITAGLYKGIKLKDNIGKIRTTERFPDSNSWDIPNVTEGSGTVDFDFDADEGLLGTIVAILLWFIALIFFSLILWIFGGILAVMVSTFVAMLYWIFFRALRLVFKNSNRSKGKLVESIQYGLFYTVLYNFWIYGILIFTEYLKT